MIRAMIVRIPLQTAAAGVRHVAVSLPYVGFLIDDRPDKYLRPEDLPPPGKLDSQPIGRQRLYNAHHFYRQRGGQNAER